MASTLSLQTLPVELINRILELLDAEQILLSFGHVCRRFHAIARNYNRLSIKFTNEPSKRNMHRLLSVVQPENIVSLSFKSGVRSPDLIKRFLRSIYVHRLTRLRSLTLCDIDESVWQIIIHPIIALSTIQSLSIYMNEKKAFSRDSIGLLSALIAVPSLRKLILDLSTNITTRMAWSTQCSIEELRIRTCSESQLDRILHQSPNLRSFAVNTYSVENVGPVPPRTAFRQLTSLTLNQIPANMDEFESLLSFFPALVCLNFQTKDILSLDFAQQFYQWEAFLGKRLPLLQNLHFCFSFRTNQLVNLESTLAPFCTHFWLEKKRWFVTARLHSTLFSHSVTLHSSMYTTEKDHDKHTRPIMEYSTTTARSDSLSKVNKDWHLRMDPSWLHSYAQFISNDFQCVNKLSLYIGQQWTSDSLDRLPLLLDLDQLTEIWLFECQECGMLCETIKYLMQRVANVRILGISINDRFGSRIKRVCSAVSNRTDHLKLRVRELDAVKQTFKYVGPIRTVTFQWNESLPDFLSEVIQWLTKKKKRFYIANNGTSVAVELNDDEDQLEEMNKTHKRMKLTHHRYGS